jgi:hypothetical protein
MTRQRTNKEPFTFIANIPMPIEAEWNRQYAYLAGFPLNLVYSGQRTAHAGEAPHVAAACYWFDPGTYREDEVIREMWYRPHEDSPYAIRVTVRKDTGEWDTFKYSGEELLYVAHGADFRSAMLQTTLVGLQPDEPDSERSASPA